MGNTAYTIQMASKISGVGVHTIRAWEKRYQALVPARDSAGHRVYSKTDVEKLMLLSELCLLGYSISKVAGHNITELKQLLMDLGKSEESLSQPDLKLIEDKSVIDWSQSLSVLLYAVRNYKLDVVSQEMQKLKTSLGAREFALEILTPLFQQLHNLKRESGLNQTQFNSLNSLINFHIGPFLHRLEKSDPSQQVLICSLNAFCDWEAKVIAVYLNSLQLPFFFIETDASETMLELMRELRFHSVIVIMNRNDDPTMLEKLNALRMQHNQNVFLFDSRGQFNHEPLAKKLTLIKDIAQLEIHLLRK